MDEVEPDRTIQCLQPDSTASSSGEKQEKETMQEEKNRKEKELAKTVMEKAKAKGAGGDAKDDEASSSTIESFKGKAPLEIQEQSKKLEELQIDEEKVEPDPITQYLQTESWKGRPNDHGPDDHGHGVSLQFHRKCHINVEISFDGKTATRQCDGDGIAISNRPLKDSEWFEVKIMQGRPPSIKVGITTLQPDTMELPDVIDNIQEDTWMVSGQYIYVLPNGLTQGTIQYGGNLDLLTSNDRVGVMWTGNREFHVRINGSNMEPAQPNLPGGELFGFISICGKCKEVKL